MKNVKVLLDGNDSISYELENNDIFSGDNVILADREQDILSSLDWYQDGVATVNIFDSHEFLSLKNKIENRILEIANSINLNFDNSFTLEKYHTFVNDTEHEQLIKLTRNITFDSLDFDFQSATKKISHFCNHEFSRKNPKLDKDFVIVRISRPGKDDFNPPHKDGYLEVWERTVNLWAPIAGCTKKSNLGVMKNSHLIPENRLVRTKGGAIFNGKKYHVPAILSVDEKNIHFTRPEIAYGDCLIFSPLLIHGCAVNLQENVTRISLEIRLSG